MSELLKSIATKEDVSGLFDGLCADMRKNHKAAFRWMFFFAVTQTIAQALILTVLL